MGHKVWLKGVGAPPLNAVESFTFPMMSAGLSPEVIKHCKLGPALKRLGDILMAKYPNAGNKGEPTIGIEFGDIEFCFRLGQYDVKKEGV